MMGGGGFLGFAIFAILIVVPFWRILPRAGIPSWVALLSILPFVAIILLWILAFRPWPGDNNRMGM